jgi:hypothetical protein
VKVKPVRSAAGARTAFRDGTLSTLFHAMRMPTRAGGYLHGWGKWWCAEPPPSGWCGRLPARRSPSCMRR